LTFGTAVLAQANQPPVRLASSQVIDYIVTSLGTSVDAAEIKTDRRQPNGFEAAT
jgi:hypothetical protein